MTFCDHCGDTVADDDVRWVATLLSDIETLHGTVFEGSGAALCTSCHTHIQAGDREDHYLAAQESMRSHGLCGQALYDDTGIMGLCAHERGVEHDHADAEVWHRPFAQEDA